MVRSIEELEQIVEKGKNAYFEVGKALIEIRDNNLYDKKRGFSSFSTYCLEKFSLESRLVYQFIAAAIAAENVRSIAQNGDIPGYAQALALSVLNKEPDKQKEISYEIDFKKASVIDIKNAVFKKQNKASNIKNQENELLTELTKLYLDLGNKICTFSLVEGKTNGIYFLQIDLSENQVRKIAGVLDEI